MATCEDCIRFLVSLAVRVQEISDEAWDILSFPELSPNIKERKWDEIHEHHKDLTVLQEDIKPCVKEEHHSKLVDGIRTLGEAINRKDLRRIDKIIATKLIPTLDTLLIDIARLCKKP